MFDRGSMGMGAAGSQLGPDQGMVPTAKSPGGAPGPDTDPLHQYFVVCTAFLGEFANAAKQIDPKLANELDSIKNRLTRRQINRQDTIARAQKEVGQAMNQNL